MFESVDVKSQSATRVKAAAEDVSQQPNHLKREQFAMTRSSEALAEARKSESQLEMKGQNGEKIMPDTEIPETKTNY